MSFSSFYAGLAGLQANAGRLQVIGNNLANVNTVGFKSSRVTFGDAFSIAAGYNGAGNPMQVGRGVQTGAIDQLFSQGSFQSTGLITDLAIQGNGFFVTDHPNIGRGFTRAGNFTFDSDGYLITTSGQLVQGFTMRDAAGNIVSSGALNNIQIPTGQTSPPLATSVLTAVINLDGDAAVDIPATAGDESERFMTSMTVYDSLGGRHDLTFEFVPVDTNADGSLDQWDYTVTAPGDEVTGGTAGTPFVLDSGTVQFDATGQITAPAGNVAIAIPGWTNGAAAQAVDWQLYDAAGAGNVTGFVAPSALSSTSQDGYSVGQLRTLTVDQDGLIAGVFTNGTTMELARLAMAVFNNPNGLLRNGQNSFLETNASGSATIGSANTGGRGLVLSNNLELSNVDMTQEFTDLIISERGYQANSRIITTTDQIVQEALNLKR